MAYTIATQGKKMTPTISWLLVSTLLFLGAIAFTLPIFLSDGAPSDPAVKKRIFVTMVLLLVGVIFIFPIFLGTDRQYLQSGLVFLLTIVMLRRGCIFSKKSKLLIFCWIWFLFDLWMGTMRRFFGWFDW